ncbi:hypothetical protein VTK26DRAFT_5226 [Humicola hyalothermophila]
MLFPEEHAPHLKKWIVKRLENTSDADADVLADYVLALLRHDGDVNAVRKLCEDEIPDFLKEDSSVFVNDVFEAIAYRSYLPGAPPPPPKHTASFPTPTAPAGAAAPPPGGLFYDDVPPSHGPPYQPQPPFPGGSRKRAYNDWDDPNAQNGRDAAAGGGYGGRTYKQPRRGGYGGRGVTRSDDSTNGFRGGAAASVPTGPAFPPAPGQLAPQQSGSAPPAPSTVGYFDPNGSLDAMFGMSLAAGRPMPEFMPPHDRAQAPPRRRARCRDWERKGFCQRGSNCMFEHSNDPVYPPMPGPPFGGMQSVPQPSAVEEYDPTNALMPNLYNGPNPLQGQQPYGPDGGQQPKHKGGRHHHRQRRGPEKAPFSADGPVYDRTKSTIVVENIPEENFSEEQVKEFFSQFGNILEVSMQPYKRLAIVKYDSWNSANAAYQSPKVIFDNRFVKVFWYKDDESTLPASVPLTGGAPGGRKTHVTNGSAVAGASDAGPQPEIDMEEFARKQEERQKAFEEKTRKREELERQRRELEQRQKELIARQMEEKAKLEAKLAQRSGGKSKEGGGGGENGDATKSSKPMSQTEALRAQLAALEAEARQMGLDPDAMSDAPAPAPWPPRGGYSRGRGGGWRGSYAPRGYRGGARGRANVHAAYAAYSLDNRPKKVVVTGVDFTAPEKDETLRQYLFGIGEFTDIQTTPSSTEITFKDRKTAEKFFNSVILNNKEIPGLDPSTPVELTWGSSSSAPTANGSVPTTPGSTYNNTNASTNSGPSGATGTSGTAPTSNTGAGTDTAGTATAPGKHMTQPVTGGGAMRNGGSGDKDEGAAVAAGSSSSDKDVHILLERPPDQNEMDYEVADENQWEY